MRMSGLAQAVPSVNSLVAPSLETALAPLSDAEKVSVESFSFREKFLFILGYEYMCAVFSQGLRFPDGKPYRNFSSQALEVALSFTSSFWKFVKPTEPEEVQGLASITDQTEVTAANESDAQGAIRKYRPLRDRLAWEIFNGDPARGIQGQSIMYEVWGDDPNNPGVIITRILTNDPAQAPDLEAMFSHKTPAQLYQDGLLLQKKYQEIDVPFEPVGLGKPRMGAVLVLPLAVIITLCIAALVLVSLLGWFTERFVAKKRINDAIDNDPTLTPEQRLAAKAKANRDLSWIETVTGLSPESIERIAVIAVLAAGTVAALYFGVPALIEAFKKSGSSSRRYQPEGAMA